MQTTFVETENKDAEQNLTSSKRRMQNWKQSSWCLLSDNSHFSLAVEERQAYYTNVISLFQ